MRNQWDIQNDVITLALGNLPAGMLSTQVRTENAPFSTPNDKEWVDISFINTGTTRQDASNCYKIITGIMNIDVYAPKEIGDKTAKDIAQHFSNLFSNIWLNEVRFDLSNIRPSTEQEWYRLIVETPYTIEGTTNGS